MYFFKARVYRLLPMWCASIMKTCMSSTERSHIVIVPLKVLPLVLVCLMLKRESSLWLVFAVCWLHPETSSTLQFLFSPNWRMFTLRGFRCWNWRTADKHLNRIWTLLPAFYGNGSFLHLFYRCDRAFSVCYSSILPFLVKKIFKLARHLTFQRVSLLIAWLFITSCHQCCCPFAMP